jgi:hypothetical protein
MKFRSTYLYESNLAADQLKKKVFQCFEAGDILKHQEFSPEYKSFSSSHINSLSQTTFINDHKKKYLGRYEYGNFTLWSPKILFWNRVTLFIIHKKLGSAVLLELNRFWLFFVTLNLINIVALIAVINSPVVGITFLLLTISFTILFVVKINKSIRYFRQKIFDR